MIQGNSISWYNGEKMTFESFNTLIDHNFDAFCKEVNGELGKGTFALKSENGKII